MTFVHIYSLLLTAELLPITSGFYPRDAMLARVLAVIVCPSIRLSVCLSHAGIVSKWLNIGSLKHHHVIAQGSSILTPTFVGGRPQFTLKFVLKVTHPFRTQQF